MLNISFYCHSICVYLTNLSASYKNARKQLYHDKAISVILKVSVKASRSNWRGQMFRSSYLSVPIAASDNVMYKN